MELLELPAVSEAGVQLWVKRDDLLRMGPEHALCGNKWRKLQYNLQLAKERRLNCLLTFGGAYSNHIAAVAAAGKVYDFQTIGIIRGERVLPLNPTLQLAESCGMQLQFISRTVYRDKTSASFLKKLEREYGAFYLLPEGGTNHLAMKGCEQVVREVESQLGGLPDYFFCSVGTGGTLAGMIAASTHYEQDTSLIGFSSLKGDFLKSEVEAHLRPYLGKVPENWKINTDFHFGGYARHKAELIDFINDFKTTTGLALDPVYTGKMFYGILNLITAGHFPKGSRLVAVHSGGLQGIRGFNEQNGNIIK
jgi:1-aminocyclopropane-1-carboxylate deaminase/D-cysteine desulfhydrase-like pyridoxal-dependent ACC family enzyme